MNLIVKCYQKIIICARKLNEVLTALERHEGEEFMIEFLGELSLEVYSSVDRISSVFFF